MSFACGTLAHPEAFKLGNKGAASANGKQHSIPGKFQHEHFSKAAAIEACWTYDPKQTSKAPSRMWGSTTATKYGGELRPDTEPHGWTHGEVWNIDSNIKKWGEHETRRNAATAAHDIHRHDQYQRVVLLPATGAKKTMAARLCTSGVVSPDCCFLESWGFDLGLRDRQARPTGLWRPVGKSEMFRAPRSYDRNITRILDHQRSLKMSQSAPGFCDGLTTTMRPEDVGGEAGEHGGSEAKDHETAGKTHGSRSCNYHDSFDHTAKREAAKLSCGIHSPTFKEHHDGHPFIEEIELRPQAIYTLKYRQAEKNQPGSGNLALRKREGNSRRVATGL